MIEKYGKKLFILLGCDVVYFILMVIPGHKDTCFICDFYRTWAYDYDGTQLC